MALTRARAEEQLLTDLELRQLIYAAQTQTEKVAQLASGIVNNVLSCELVVIPAEGYLTREYGTPFGSIALSNHGGSAATVAAGGPVGDVPPGQGVAMGRLNPGVAASTFALTGHQLTIYGTAGNTFTLQVFTSCVTPGFAA